MAFITKVQEFILSADFILLTWGLWSTSQGTGPRRDVGNDFYTFAQTCNDHDVFV